MIVDNAQQTTVTRE